MYNRVGYGTAGYSIIAYCGVTCYPCSRSFFLLRTVYVTFVLNGILCLTASWFALFIRLHASEYSRGHFMAPRCMHFIGISVYAFGSFLRQEFFTFDCNSAVALLLETDVAHLPSRGLDWVPPNGCRIVVRDSCPCSNLSYRSFDGFFHMNQSYPSACS